MVAAEYLDQMQAPQNLEENIQCAAEGGEVAHVTKEQLESKTGRSVVFKLSAKRFFEEQKVIEGKAHNTDTEEMKV